MIIPFSKVKLTLQWVTWAISIQRGESLSNRFYISESNPAWLSLLFSDGNFKASGKPTKPSVGTSKESLVEVEETRDEQEAATKAIYSCPQDGCTRTFQRHAALERHLSFEKCTKSVERGTMLDQAKKQYAARVLEGVGKIPALTSMSVSTTKTTEGLKEGWALKQLKKPYRFNEKQKSFLVSKFNIGQDTGRKMDPEIVARGMRRERDAHGERLFSKSEFLTPGQVSSFFSRLAAKTRKQPAGEPLEEDDLAAVTEEENFVTARESVLTAIQLVHPIICDQQNVCEMVKAGSLAKQKVGQLQVFCTELGLDVPSPPVRRKAPYVTLLQELVQKCGCMDKY